MNATSLTVAQEKMLSEAKDNGGWMRLSGSASYRVARNLESAGIGRVTSSRIDEDGCRIWNRGVNGGFFILNEN